MRFVSQYKISNKMSASNIEFVFPRNTCRVFYWVFTKL